MTHAAPPHFESMISDVIADQAPTNLRLPLDFHQKDFAIGQANKGNAIAMIAHLVADALAGGVFTPCNVDTFTPPMSSDL